MTERDRSSGAQPEPLDMLVCCLCPGCPERIPSWWASGLCRACINEDCEHDEPASPEPQTAPAAPPLWTAETSVFGWCAAHGCYREACPPDQAAEHPQGGPEPLCRYGYEPNSCQVHSGGVRSSSCDVWLASSKMSDDAVFAATTLAAEMQIRCTENNVQHLASALHSHAEAESAALRDRLEKLEQAVGLLRANLVGVLQEAEGVAHTSRTAASLAIEDADAALAPEPRG